MTTTAKDIIQAALAGNTGNDPDDLAGTPELVQRLSYKLRALCARANALNPWWSVVKTTVTGDASKWVLPSASPILYIHAGGEAGTGADAVLGSTEDLDLEVYRVRPSDTAAALAPRVYQSGEDLYSVGASGDPDPSVDGDTLAVYQVAVHPELDDSAEPDAAANTLEELWPEQFNELLVMYLQEYLASKDEGRALEAARLAKQIEPLEASFLAYAKQRSMYETVRFD